MCFPEFPPPQAAGDKGGLFAEDAGLPEVKGSNVEKEKPEENIDWDWNEKHKQAWKVISDTYDWWKTRRPCREDILQDVVIPDDYMTFGEQDENGNYPVIWGDYPEISEKMAEANRLETERYEEDTEMMKRIVSVREYMWT